jgi:phospholipase DDHD1
MLAISCAIFSGTELKSRLDYMLKERTMESAYLATLTSHTAYWTNMDVALFILMQIFSSPNSCLDS